MTCRHNPICQSHRDGRRDHEELSAVYLNGTKIPQILREVRCGGSSVEGASVAVGASQYGLLLDRFAAGADIDFLVDDAAMEEFLTTGEHEELLVLARSDFVQNLESTIDAERDAFESGWDPDDWFMYMRETVDALERLFPDDEVISDVETEARETIRDRVIDLKRRIEEDEVEDDDETPHAVGQAATASEVRSIFDDLTQRS